MLESEGNRPYHLHLVTLFDFQDLNTNQDIPDSNAAWTWPTLWRGEKVGKPRVGSISAGIVRYLGHLTQNASLMSESWINKLWEQGLPPATMSNQLQLHAERVWLPELQLLPNLIDVMEPFCRPLHSYGASHPHAVPSNAGFSRDEGSWGLGSNSIYARTWSHFKQVRTRVLFSIKGFVRQKHAGSATKNLGLGQLL